MPKSLLIGLLFLFPLSLFSTDYDLYRLVYGSAEGLPSTECYEIIQDSKGYIWFGTDNGVVKYNGVEFITFTTADGLNNNVNYNLFADKEGNVWCYDKTHQIYRITNDQVYPYPYNHLLKEYIDESALPISFVFDNERKLHVSLILNLKNNILNSIDQFGEVGLIVMDSVNLEINQNGKGTTFIGPHYSSEIVDPSCRCRLVKVSGSNADTVLKLPMADSTIYRWIYRFQQTDSLLYFNLGNRIFSLDGDMQSRELHEFEHGVIELEVDADQNIFIGLSDDGLWLAPKGDFSNLTQLIGHCSVSSFMIDRVGSYWVSTLDDGIFYIPSFDFYEHPGSCGSNVMLISGDQKEIVYCTRNGSLGSIESWGEFSSIPESGYAHSLLSFNDSSYLISIGGNESYYFPTITQLPVTKQMNGSDWFLKDSIYYGVATNSIVSFNPTKALPNKKIYNSHYNLNCIDDSFSKNELLVGTNNGIYSYTDDTLIRWAPEYDLFNTEIVDLKLFASNVLLAATGSKGLIIHYVGQKPILMNEQSGLICNDINKLHVYKNKVFIMTKQGLSILTFNENPLSYYINNYTTKNGLSSNVTNDIFVRNDTAWIATSMGITKFALSPNEKTKDLESPIILDDFLVDKQVIRNTTNIQLDNWDNEVKITYEILDYTSGFDINFRTKLIGFDSNWKYTTETTYSNSNLPAGDYEFQVAYQKNDHSWSLPITLVKFSKMKPFWRPMWTAFIIAFSFIILGWVIGRRYIRRKKKDTNIKKTISDLERRALQAQMNPHFIFNSLTSIQSLIAQDKNQEAETFLVTFSKLVRKALNQSSNDSFSNLGDEIELLENYIKLESLRFSNSFNYTIEVAKGIDVADYQIPPMIIQPFVENAIEHGLMKSENDRILEISIQPKDDFLITCTISDNGIGRLAAKKASQKNGHKSKGIDLIKDRLKIINTNANVTFSDLDVTKKNCGTLVTITVPYKNLAE
ncbi:MAG: two-component sensor histidine kinase [Crocinitomix sp.]